MALAHAIWLFTYDAVKRSVTFDRRRAAFYIWVPGQGAISTCISVANRRMYVWKSADGF